MDAYVLSWLGKRTPPCFQRVVSLFSPCFSLLFTFGEICLSALFLTVIARSHSIAFPVFLGKSPCFRGKTGGRRRSAISRTSFKVAGPCPCCCDRGAGEAYRGQSQRQRRQFYSKTCFSFRVAFGHTQQHADHRHSRLLGARYERPSNRSTTGDYEIAALHPLLQGRDHSLTPGRECAASQQEWTLMSQLGQKATYAVI